MNAHSRPAEVHEGLHGRFNVIDPIALGKLIARWSLDPATAPTTIAELKAALEPGIALVPSRCTTLRVVQDEVDEFVLRLPPKHMIEDSVAEFSAADRVEEPYQVPSFYALKLRAADGSEPVVSNEYLNDNDFFLARISDYVVSYCR